MQTVTPKSSQSDLHLMDAHFLDHFTITWANRNAVIIPGSATSFHLYFLTHAGTVAATAIAHWIKLIMGSDFQPMKLKSLPTTLQIVDN